MEYVGLDPQGAGELARRFDAAALDLETHASVVAQLLDQAGVSSAAPRQMREIAAWAAYRSRDLRKRDKEVSYERSPDCRTRGGSCHLILYS